MPWCFLINNKNKQFLQYCLSDPQQGSDSSVREPYSHNIWCVSSAVHRVSWGISVKWMLTNVARRPATTVPFARILLIATSATAGQVSHSDLRWGSRFTLKWGNQCRLFSFISPVTARPLWLMNKITETQPEWLFYCAQDVIEYSSSYVNYGNTSRRPIFGLKEAI